jgi:molecular chaperone DnaK (HSP70)
LFDRKFKKEELEEEIKNLDWGFKVVYEGTEDIEPIIEVLFKEEKITLTVNEVIKELMQNSLLQAEVFLGKKVKKILLSTPNYFNKQQNQKMKELWEEMDIEVVAIVPREICTLLSYDMDVIKNENDGKTKKIVVFDFVSTSLAVSVIEVYNGLFSVIGKETTREINGHRIDKKLFEFLLIEVKKKLKSDITDNKKSVFKLKLQVEQAKITLSNISKGKNFKN